MADPRVRVDVTGSPQWGTLSGERVRLDDGGEVAAADATFLAPVEPTKIIATHLTYRSRVEEYAARVPAEPSYFMKPPSTLNGHGGALRRPRGARFLNYEGEVAAVIGRRMHGVPEAEALAYVAGYAPGERRRAARLPPRRPRLDAAGEGPGRLLPDRPRAHAGRRLRPRPTSASARS